jgi:hypothetical protein
MRWVVNFAVICLATVVVVLAIFWLSGWADALGLSGDGFIALALGTIFTVGLGVALMALVFYSNRTGQDDTAHDIETKP